MQQNMTGKIFKLINNNNNNDFFYKKKIEFL